MRNGSSLNDTSGESGVRNRPAARSLAPPRPVATAVAALVLELEWVLASELALEISYQPGWREGAALEDCLREGSARDVRFGLTHCGPHRADLRLTVGGQPASAVLSRGQAKVVASALRLAQAELTNQLGGRTTLFLIDDIGAEMDAPHNERFFGALEAMDCQVFATTTSDIALGAAFAGARRRLFHVEHGSCQQIDTQES